MTKGTPISLMSSWLPGGMPLLPSHGTLSRAYLRY